jgi:MGT family glycosyltransferase
VGHINPYMSLALALRDHGHEVAFYTDESLRDVIEGQGFRLFPFVQINPNSWKRIHARESMATNRIQSLHVGLRAFQDWLFGTIPDQVADLQPIISSWQPDALVVEPAMWGPILILWETTRVPVAILSTLMGCLIPGPEAPAWGLGLPPPRNFRMRLLAHGITRATDLLALHMRRRVDRLRAIHGLRAMGCSVTAFTARLPLYLVPSVHELDYNRRDLPESVHYIGPCVWNKPAQMAPPAWLDELPTDHAWVHITEGTAHYQGPFVLRAAIEGLAHQPVQVIITTGSERDPATLELGSLASNIRVEQWVSHSDLLPRCAAIVTTGGAGTIMAALKVGLPLLIVPTHWDKPDNAQRVVTSGAGLSLSPKQCTPERLRAGVQRLLTEPKFRANARYLAQCLAAAPGPPGAVELLEALVAETICAARYAARTTVSNVA